MKNKLVKIVSIVAVMALAISLSACGKKNKVEREPIDGAGEGYEFVAKSLSLKELLGKDVYVEEAVASNGNLYIVSSSEEGQKLHTINMETMEDKAVDLDFSEFLPETEAVPEMDEAIATTDEENGEPAETDSAAADVSGQETGSFEEGEGYVGDMYMDEAGMYRTEVYDSGSSVVSKINVADDGSVLFLLTNWEGEDKVLYVIKMAPDGKKSLLYSASDIGNDDRYINQTILKKDGGLYLAINSKLISLDKEGKKVGEVDAGDWIYGIFENAAGECFASFYSQAEGSTVTKKVDFANSSFGESTKISASNGNVFQADEDTFLVVGYESVTEVNAKTEESKKLWDWINLDVSDVNTESFAVNSDGSYSIFSNTYTDTGVEYEYISISKQEISPENARTEIIYGCPTIDWDVRHKITAFNKSQDKYRIIVKQYIDMNGGYDEDSYNEQYARFKADLATGTAFDIVSVDSTDFTNVKLAQKGVFLDLSDFYKTAVNRSDYFENILDIFKVDGKDYFAVSNVNLITMIGKGSEFKGKTTWTPQDLVELRKKYPDKEFLLYGSKENAVSTTVIYTINSFIDYEKGKCDFCKQEFYDLLNFANTFPKDPDYSEGNEYTKLAGDGILVTELYLYDLSSLTVYRQVMGDDAVIIGPPNNEGIRAQVIPNSVFAISAKTPDKEGCYEFLKYYMESSDDETMGGASGMPVRKQAFYDRMKKEITPETYEDENGNVVEANYSYTIGTADGYIEVRRPSQTEVDIVEDLMKTASATIRLDEKFLEIFLEEVQPFFEGQKTAEETANVLQSRVSIYLSENE